MVNKSDIFPSGVTKVQETFVREINRKLAKGSEHNIFAKSREQIEDYKSLVGQRLNAVSVFNTSQ